MWHYMRKYYILSRIKEGGNFFMNETIRTIQQRRSIRKFKSDMPSHENIDAIINAGLFAANTHGKQDPIIIAVTNKDLRDKISLDNCKIGGWHENFDPFYNAPVILIVLASQDWPNRVYDGSLVIGNMMLAAHSLGLGSIWIHRAKQEFESDYYKNLLAKLGITSNYEGIGHCAIG